MANNFKPWVDSATAGQQVQSASVFASDAQRVDGFKAGDPASALRVNSALRQANVVVAALMQMCDEVKTLPNELSLLSTVTQVKNAIKDSIDALHNTTLSSAKDYTNSRETAIDARIANVQTQVTGNKNDITTLTTRVGTLETEMNTAQADIVNNSSDIESLGADVERKLEKNFGGFYDEKTSLADNDLLVIQDSADSGTPKANKKTKINALKMLMRDFLYPVGSIYMSINSANPSTLFGGTWIAWGAGRVPVSVDTNQTEFNSVEKIGGAKTHVLSVAEMPAHSHSVYISGGTATQGLWANDADGRRQIISSGSAGSGQAHNNLQPYITCYMWKRTA